MNRLTKSIAITLGLVSFTTNAESESLPAFCTSLQNATLDNTAVSVISKQHSCRVTSRVWPIKMSQSKESFIEVYTWLPAPDKWNGRFIAFGNGGYSDSIAEEAMNRYLEKGFAVGATDTGHKGDSLTFALDAPERIDYWGRLAVHTLSQYSEKLIHQAYGETSQYSYFTGCSTGGHQALTSVQFYPDDFDGVLAGAPGHNRVALNAAFLWLFQQSHDKHTSKPVITKADLALLSEEVTAQCSEKQGAAEGVITSIEHCEPDLSTLQCQTNQSKTCLIKEKINRLNNIYQGPVDPITGEQIYPGFPPGSEFTGESGWAAYRADPTSPSQPARADFWRLWALDDPDWDPWKFDWHKDYQYASKRLSSRIDATKTDLSAFMKNGGKLILYHGLADPVVSATDTARYYKQAGNATTGPFNARLYEVPGMSHCAGGTFIDTFDAFPALQKWVEKNEVPKTINVLLKNKDASYPLAPEPIPKR